MTRGSSSLNRANRWARETGAGFEAAAALADGLDAAVGRSCDMQEELLRTSQINVIARRRFVAMKSP
jgi:hypothetical protein